MGSSIVCEESFSLLADSTRGSFSPSVEYITCSIESCSCESTETSPSTERCGDSSVGTGLTLTSSFTDGKGDSSGLSFSCECRGASSLIS